MERNTIIIRISQSVAIRIGLPTKGDHEIDVASLGLTAEDRATLASLPFSDNAGRRLLERHTSFGADLPEPQGIDGPSVSEWLAAYRADVARREAERQAEQAAKAAAVAERIKVLEALPDFTAPTYTISAGGDYSLYPEPMKDRALVWLYIARDGSVGIAQSEGVPNEGPLRDRLKSACQAAEAFRGNMQANRAAVLAAIKQAEKDAAQARTDAIAEYVRTHGTPAQARRLARGLMPGDEQMAVVRDATFRPLDSLPRYERIAKEEVLKSYADAGIADFGDTEPKVAFAANPANEVTDAQLEAIEQIEHLLPGCTVTARDHVGYLKDTTEDQDARAQVERRSAHVAIDVPGIGEITREYAL